MDPPAAQPSQSEVDEFKRVVSAWVEYDDAVRKLRVAISERRTAMKALQKSIIAFMTRYNVDALNTKHGKISMNTRKSKAPIRVTDIQQSLSQIALQGQTSVDVAALMKTLFEGARPVVESSSLKRILPRVSMALEL